MDPTLLTTLRALKKSAPALLVLIALRRPVGVMELVRILEINPRTAEAMLQSLTDLGIAERVSYHGGYALTPNADDTLHILLLVSSSSKESIKLIKESTSSSNLQNTQSETRKSARFGVDTATILSNTDKIFPTPVIANGLDVERLDPEIVLAWCAQVYVGMRNVNIPAAVVYRRLKENATPSAEFVEDPLRYLPAKFLNAVGLPVPPDNLTPSGFTLDDDEPETVEHNSRTLANPAAAASAWEQIKARIMHDDARPRAALETWVADSRGIGHDDTGALIVAARTSYARDWMAANLTEYLDNIKIIAPKG